MTSCYDDISSLYHLFYDDWEAAISRQATQLDKLIRSFWGADVSTILDVSCGIGTQCIGLASMGYDVKGSDASPQSIVRARAEASKRGLSIDFSVCDVRSILEQHGTGFDLIISCDNALPHLLTDDDIKAALHQMRSCVRSGGGCLLSIREYDVEERGVGLFRHHSRRSIP